MLKPTMSAEQQDMSKGACSGRFKHTYDGRDMNNRKAIVERERRGKQCVEGRGKGERDARMEEESFGKDMEDVEAGKAEGAAG